MKNWCKRRSFLLPQKVFSDCIFYLKYISRLVQTQDISRNQCCILLFLKRSRLISCLEMSSTKTTVHVTTTTTTSHVVKRQKGPVKRIQKTKRRSKSPAKKRTCTKCSSRQAMADNSYCRQCRCREKIAGGQRCPNRVADGRRLYCNTHGK